jgi:hypothetical protein
MARITSQFYQHLQARRQADGTAAAALVAKTKRILTGAKIRTVGRTFEAWIEVAAARDARGPVAELAHLPSAGARWVRHRGQTKAIPEPIPCDFMGTFYPHGISLHFDAKTTAAEDGHASARLGN